jgi:hypothetical protein
MPKRVVRLNDLASKLDEDQVDRFLQQQLPLETFLNTKHEELITESIAVLRKMSEYMPDITIRWG